MTGRLTPKGLNPKSRNPQDATLRNVRALKTRVARLEQQMRALRAQLKVRQ